MASLSRSGLYWKCTPSFDFTKPTLVFLHAAWMSSTMFDETVSQLTAMLPNRNLLCIDLNGHGKTTMGRKVFTLWDQGDDLVALMDELNIQKAILVGISMGADIALRVALSNPSRVTALVLMASTAEASSPEATAAIGQVRDVWVSTPSPSEEIMDIAIQGWGGDADLKGLRAERIKRHWVARHSGAENVDAILQSMDQRENLIPRLHEITAPVLLVHGERDETWDVQEAFRIRDAIGKDKARTYILKDAGHLVIHMRDSEDVSQVISEFIKQVLPQDLEGN